MNLLVVQVERASSALSNDGTFALTSIVLVENERRKNFIEGAKKLRKKRHFRSHGYRERPGVSEREAHHNVCHKKISAHALLGWL